MYDLLGKIISLNLAKCKRFNCGGFSVNMNSPSAVVMNGAQQDRIWEGLYDGRLIDVTDQNVKGLDLQGARHTKPVLEDTGEKVYITIAPNGAMSVAIPKDSEEQEAFDKQITENGSLILSNPKLADKPSPLMQGLLPYNHRGQFIENFTQTIDQIKRSQK